MLVRLLPWERRVVGAMPRTQTKTGSWVCHDCSASKVSRSGLDGRAKRPAGYRRTDHDRQSHGFHSQAIRPRRSSASNSLRKRNAHVSLEVPVARTGNAVRPGKNNLLKSSTASGQGPRLWRSVSSAASVEELESMFEEDSAQPSADTSAPVAHLPPETRQMLGKISVALQQGASDWLFKIVRPALLESKTMSAITDDAFTGMLSLWCSKDYFEDLIEHHLAISATNARDIRITPLATIIDEYLSIVTNVVHMRRTSGLRLSTEQYEHLLRAAHMSGSSTVAQLFWNWMSEDNAARNVECYAHYLGAHVWNDLLPAYRERSHLTPFNAVARENPYAGEPFDNYRVRMDGIKQFVTTVFAQLTRDQLGVNEELICHVMTGLAREGDVKGMQRLLSRSWGIDVAGIMADNDSKPSRDLTADSPLQPTDRLLTTLAFCYGINSDLPKALRVIDYVSRHYSLSPSQEVWKLVLNWAYVLSRRRKTTSEFQAVLEPSAVYNVWETMQAPPYNVTPSLDMFDKLVRALHASQRAADVWAVMGAGLELRRSEVAALAAAEEALHSVGSDDKGAVERAQRRYESRLMAVSRGAKYLKTWTRLLLGLTESAARLPEPGAAVEKLCYEDVPGLLGGEWASYAGRRLRYTVPTGVVEIEAADEQQVLGLHRRLQTQGRRRKAALDHSVRAVGHEWVVKEFDSRRLQEASV